MGARSADKSREAGVTLVELLVATAILVMGAMGLFLMSSSATHGNIRSADEAAASALAIAKIEELKNASFGSVTVASCQDEQLDASGASGSSYARSCTVTTGTVNGTSSKDVTVTVSWTGGGSTSVSTRIVDPDEESPGMPKAFVRSWDQTS